MRIETGARSSGSAHNEWDGSCRQAGCHHLLGHLARPARFQPAQVLVDAFGPDTGGKQEVALRCEHLAAVALGKPHVADEHGRRIIRKERAQSATWRS